MSGRTVVFWIGDKPPEAVRRELGRRNLEVKCGMPTRALELSRGGQLQAVLVPYHDSLRQTLETLYTPVLHSGARLEVVVVNPETYDSDRQSTATALIGFRGLFQGDGRDSHAHEVAERCARHSAGRSANSDLRFEGSEISDMGRRILFQRAFSDFAKIEVTALTGGRSGADVFQVNATSREEHGSQPFVVKIGSVSDITAEIDALNSSVVSFVPFRNRAPHVESRCVSGPKERLLTSLLVERAERLDDYLRSHEPDLAIAAIFAGPLRNWRDDITEHEANLGQQYQSCGILPRNAEVLRAAYEEAAVMQPSALSPAELLERICAIGPRKVQRCYSHGDLHARNIFVTYGGNDVILIDFDQTTQQERLHAALDLAVLDVSLALDGVDGDLPARPVTLNLYEPPLLALRPRQRNTGSGAARNRVRAIHDLRSHARGCSGGFDYDVGVACALLRVARLDVVAVERRALAYSIAERLVTYATSRYAQTA